jgi:hypothetical protein
MLPTSTRLGFAAQLVYQDGTISKVKIFWR